MIYAKEIREWDTAKILEEIDTLKKEIEKQKQERTEIEKKFADLAEKIKSLSSDL